LDQIERLKNESHKWNSLTVVRECDWKNPDTPRVREFQSHALPESLLGKGAAIQTEGLLHIDLYVT